MPFVNIKKPTYKYSPNPTEDDILQHAEGVLNGSVRTPQGTIITQPGDTQKAFGEHLKSKTFQKGLRKMQEKMKVSMLA